MQEIIDCFATLGRPAAPAGTPYLTPEALLADMDRLGIAETYCADYRALECSATVGNDLLCETIHPHPRLHPVWVVLPEATEETVAPERLGATLAASGVRMVRAEPVRQGYAPAEWCAASLWTALERFQIPVLLESNDRWDSLQLLLTAHPTLPVILTRTGYRCTRMLLPLLQKHSHLHFEISGFLVNEGLVEMAKWVGPERMLFGTDAPHLPPTSALGTLRYSGLAPEAAALVAGGNLRRLTERAAQMLKGR